MHLIVFKYWCFCCYYKTRSRSSHNEGNMWMCQANVKTTALSSIAVWQVSERSDCWLDYSGWLRSLLVRTLLFSWVSAAWSCVRLHWLYIPSLRGRAWTLPTGGMNMYGVFLWIRLTVTSAERDCVTACLTFLAWGLPNQTPTLHLSCKADQPLVLSVLVPRKHFFYWKCYFLCLG